MKIFNFKIATTLDSDNIIIPVNSTDSNHGYYLNGGYLALRYNRMYMVVGEHYIYDFVDKITLNSKYKIIGDVTDCKIIIEWARRIHRDSITRQKYDKIESLICDGI